MTPVMVRLRQIAERCDEPPVVTWLEKIGSFRAFTGD